MEKVEKLMWTGFAFLVAGIFIGREPAWIGCGIILGVAIYAYKTCKRIEE